MARVARGWPRLLRATRCRLLTVRRRGSRSAVFLERTNGGVATPEHVRGAPELVIEIGSPGTRQRDETIKRRLYQRFGVSEYWVVDPDLEVVRIYRRDGQQFNRAVELSREAGDILATPLLSGLNLPLERIFRE